MKVRVKLIATYRRHLPPSATGDTVELNLPPGTTIREAVLPFGFPLDESSVVVLNGLTVPLDTGLSEDDTITAFSAIAGG